MVPASVIAGIGELESAGYSPENVFDHHADGWRYFGCLRCEIVIVRLKKC
jgi:hypothetical protein